MAENCNECSIAWIRGSDYVEVSAYNGSTLKNRTLKLKEENPEDVKITQLRNQQRWIDFRSRSEKIRPKFTSSEKVDRRAAGRTD